MGAGGAGQPEMELETTLVETWREEEEGPADTVQPGQVYCYSSDEEEEDAVGLVWQHRLKRRPRYVSRARGEVLLERLDLGTFTPMMTSERVEPLVFTGQKRGRREGLGSLRVGSKRGRRGSQTEDVEKRRRRASSEDGGRRRKRERRGSDYGSLSSLGSDKLRYKHTSDPKTVSGWTWWRTTKRKQTTSSRVVWLSSAPWGG